MAIIGVDVDGVLLDTHKPWIDRYNMISGDNLTKNDIYTWNISDHVMPAYQSSIHQMRTPDMYLRTPPIKNAIGVTCKLSLDGHWLIAISHDDMIHANVKCVVIRKLFPWIRDIVITGSGSSKKEVVNVDILIDDAIHNKPDILFRRPWNELYHHTLRADNWLDVVDIIKDIV